MAVQPIAAVLIGAELEENLAIRYLAAAIAARGHTAIIAPCAAANDFQTVIDRIRETRPKLVAISIAFQTEARKYLELANEIRSRGFDGHIIVGGHFPTFEFREILQQYPAVDSVGRFDGEELILALADALASGAEIAHVPNLVYRDDGTIRENPCKHSFPDLDALPLPVRDQQPRQRFGENAAAILSSRGCWHSACLYCCIGAFHRQKKTAFRLRSPQNVAHEIAELVDKHDVRIFHFQDDNFTLATRDVTLARFDALAKALREARVDTNSIALFIKARPDAIDELVADALRQLGCAGVFLGIENASKTGLAALIRAAEIDHVERALAVLRARDIAVTYNLLIFHPKAVPQELRENIQFISAHDDIPLDIGRAEIVAGAPLERQVHELGLLRGSWPWWDYVLMDPAMNRIFDCYRNTLRGEASQFGPVSMQMIDLRYHAATIARLCSGAAAQSFTREVESLIRAWNKSVAESLNKIIELADSADSAVGMKSFNSDLARKANAMSCPAQTLRAKMLNYQRVRKIFQRFGVEDAIDNTPLLRKLLRC